MRTLSDTEKLKVVRDGQVKIGQTSKRIKAVHIIHIT